MLLEVQRYSASGAIVVSRAGNRRESAGECTGIFDEGKGSRRTRVESGKVQEHPVRTRRSREGFDEGFEEGV